MDIKTVREKYPQYSDLSDETLLNGIHKKFYSDIPINDFYNKVGFNSETPTVEPEKPTRTGGIASDVGKSLAATGVTMATQIPQALFAAEKKATETVSGAPYEALKYLSGQKNILDALRESYGFKTEQKEQPRSSIDVLKEQGAKPVQEAAAQAYLPGTRKLAEVGSAFARKIHSTLSPETREQIEGSVPTWDIAKGELPSLGKAPTMLGYGMQFLNVLESQVPILAAALRGKDVSERIANAANMGQRLSSGEGMGEAKSYIDKLSDKELAKASPEFVNLAKEVGAKKARNIVTDKAMLDAGVAQGVVGRFGAEITGHLLSGSFDKFALDTIKNKAARIALGTVAAGTESGLEEVAEGLAADIGVNKHVVKEIGAGAFSNLVFGALGGGPVGAYSAAMAKPKGQKAAEQETGTSQFVRDEKGNLVPAKTSETLKGTPPEQAEQAAPIEPVQGELDLQGGEAPTPKAPFQLDGGPGKYAVESDKRRGPEDVKKTEELRNQYDTLEQELSRLQKAFEAETDPVKKEALLVQAQKLDFARQEVAAQLKAPNVSPRPTTPEGQGRLFDKAPLVTEQMQDMSPVTIGQQQDLFGEPLPFQVDPSELTLAQQKASEIERKIFALEQEPKTAKIKQEIEDLKAQLPKEITEAEDTSKQRRLNDLKPPSPIVGNVISKFGLAPKAPIRNAIKNLDMTDPEDRATFIDEINKHSIKKANINMAEVEKYLSYFEEKENERPTESDSGTIEPSVSMPSEGSEPAGGPTAPISTGVENDTGSTTGTGTTEEIQSNVQPSTLEATEEDNYDQDRLKFYENRKAEIEREKSTPVGNITGTYIQKLKEFGKRLGAIKIHNHLLGTAKNKKILSAASTGDIKTALAELSKSKNPVYRHIASIAKNIKDLKIVVDDKKSEKQATVAKHQSDAAKVTIAIIDALREAKRRVDAGEKIRDVAKSIVVFPEGLTDQVTRDTTLDSILFSHDALFNNDKFNDFVAEEEKQLEGYEESARQLAGYSFDKMVVGGMFDPETNTIYLNSYWGEREGIFAHELSHAIIHNFLHNPAKRNTPAYKAMENLYNHVKENFTGKEDEYGLTNLDEFVAEGFSNPMFQYELAKMKYENTSTLSKFVASVAKILGLKNDNALTELLNIGFNEAEKGGSYKSAGSSFSLQPTKEGTKILNSLKATGGTVPTGKNERFAKETDDVDATLNKSLCDKAKDFASLGNFWGFDQSYMNVMRNQLLKLGAEGRVTMKEALDALRRIEITQVLYRGQLAIEAINTGKLTYNAITNRYKVVADPDNMEAVRAQLKNLYKRVGISAEQALEAASKGFEANRIQSVYDKINKGNITAAQLEKDIAALEIEVKPNKAPKTVKTAVEQRKFSKVEDSRIEAVRKNLNTKKTFLKNLKDDIEVYKKQAQHMGEKQASEGIEIYNTIPEVKEIARVWGVMRERVIEELVRSGVTSKEKAERWLDEMAYVPFFRTIEKQKEFDVMISKKGFNDSMKEYAFEGSMLPVENTIGNMYQWMQWSYSRSISNQHKQVALDQMRAVLPDMVKDGKDPKGSDFSVYRDGIKRDYTISNPLVAQYFLGVGTVIFGNKNLITKWISLFKKGITLVPGFSATQLIFKDTYEAMHSSGVQNPYGVITNIFQEMYKTAKGTSEARKELISRGQLSTREHAMAVSNEVDIATKLEVKEAAMHSKLLNMLGRFSALSDNLLRQAVYQQLRNEGISEDEAASRATEIFNYRRISGNPVMQFLNNYVPFLNAFTVSTQVAMNTVSGKGITAQTRSQGLSTLARATALLGVGNLMYMMMASDDDEYKRMNRYKRDKSYVIPGTGAVIPLREGLFILDKLAAEYAYNVVMHSDVTDAQMFKDAASRAIIQQITPPISGIVTAPLGAALNRDIRTGRDIVNVSQSKLLPEYQINKDTSELAKTIGKENGMSPLKVDYFLKTFFGGYMSTMTNLTNGLIAESRGKPLPAKEGPNILVESLGFGAYAGKAGTPNVVPDLYTAAHEVDRVKPTVLALAKTDREAAKELMGSKGKDMGLGAAALSIEKKFSELNRKEASIREKRATEIVTNEDSPFYGKPYTPEVKKALIDDLDKKRISMTPAVMRLRKNIYEK